MADPRSVVGLPAGVTARAATLDDLDAALAVTRAAEHDAGLGTLTVRGDLAGDWARPSMDLGTDVVMVEERGAVVAYGEQFGGRAFAHVHPDARGRGIGSAVAAWTEHHARAAGLPRVGQTLPTTATHGPALLVARGYEPRWESWILRMPLDAPLPATRPPRGVTVRALHRPDDDRELHAVIDEAFDTWPERETLGFEDWRASFLDRASDPELVLVAEEVDRLVGAALCIPEGDEGWVDQLAVLPSHWGRGIGGALLRETFRRFRARGLATAALSTDSRTGALGLYEHVGMTATESFTRYSLELS